MINALQTIITRERDPLEPRVLSIGSIYGGNSHSLIPDIVELCGTVRYLTPEMWDF